MHTEPLSDVRLIVVYDSIVDVHDRYRVTLLDAASGSWDDKTTHGLSVPRRQQLELAASTLQLLTAITEARQCSRADFMAAV